MSISTSQDEVLKTKVSLPFKILLFLGCIGVLTTVVVSTFVWIIKGAVGVVDSSAALMVLHENITFPAVKSLESEINTAFAYILVNSSIVILLYCLLLFFPLADPTRQNHFPQLLRKWIVHDKTVRISLVIPVYRKARDRSLLQLMVVTSTAGILAAIVHGVFIGILISPEPRGVSEAFMEWLVSLAYIVPHGVFELAGLYLPFAIALVAYRSLRQEFLDGEKEVISRYVQEVFRFRKLWPMLVLSLALIAVAAVIEANYTVGIAESLEEWMR